jgi:hypothetical protein
MSSISQRYSFPFILCSFALCSSLNTACSNTADEPPTDENVIDTPDSSADASSDSSTKDSGATSKDSGATSKDSGKDSALDSADAGDASDAPDGSLDADAAPACDYTGNACASATSMGSVRGDMSSDKISTTGQTSMWIRATVEEGSSVLNTGLSFKATLKSPAAMNYDLFVYTNCGGQSLYGKSEQPAGSDDTVSGGWGDTFGVSDTRDIYIEVRYISGKACADAAQWTLTIEGNK